LAFLLSAGSLPFRVGFISVLPVDEVGLNVGRGKRGVRSTGHIEPNRKNLSADPINHPFCRWLVDVEKRFAFMGAWVSRCF
jgi:hypothetical protein